jgi:molybdopterin-binding protein
MDCDFPLASLVTRRSVEELALTEGQGHLVSFEASAVHRIAW